MLMKRSDSNDLQPPFKDQISPVIFKSGGQGRDRTADAGLFRAALYH
jgi:hypothetical protein